MAEVWVHLELTPGNAVFDFTSENFYQFSQWRLPMAQRVKNLPTMHNSQETQVQPLGQEGALEEEMVSNYTVFLPKKIPWTEDPGSLQSKESQRGRHNWARMHQRCLIMNTIVRQGPSCCPGKVNSFEICPGGKAVFWNTPESIPFPH